LFKSGFTTLEFKKFIDSYQSYKSPKNNQQKPFVYVDENGVKLITDVVDDFNDNIDGVFAISVAEDGWMELLALYDSQ
jgi:hypothetical protein